jgi:hypothetical protein
MGAMAPIRKALNARLSELIERVAVARAAELWPSVSKPSASRGWT